MDEGEALSFRQLHSALSLSALPVVERQAVELLPQLRLSLYVALRCPLVVASRAPSPCSAFLETLSTPCHQWLLSSVSLSLCLSGGWSHRRRRRRPSPCRA